MAHPLHSPDVPLAQAVAASLATTLGDWLPWRRAASPVPRRLRPPPAPLPAVLDAETVADDDAAMPTPRCGWFDSSRVLQQGLAVTEWPAEDWATAALYFAPLQPSGVRVTS